MEEIKINWSHRVQRESARLEWKENVADERGVVKTLCAFANDIQQVGGGQVICGLKEEKNDFGDPVARPVGLDEKRFKEIKNKVLSICHRNVEPPLTPTVEEYPAADDLSRKILIFSVTSSGFAHRYRAKNEGAQYYVRVNDRTQPANGLIAKLLEQKKNWPPYLEQTHPDTTTDDIDWYALKEFFGRLELPRPLPEYLEPDVQFRGDVRSLVTFPPGGGKRHAPRNYSLLLFGKEPHRFFHGAYAIFSVYLGKDKAAARSQRYELFGPIPALIRNIMQTLQLHMGIEIDKSSDMLSSSQNRRRYSVSAVQEAIVNAFVHRDYHSHEPVRVTVFSDRIQVANPGGIYNGIRLEQLKEGVVQPSWRNPSLAWFMVGLNFAQNEGRGIRIIIDETRKVAQKEPVFDIVGNWFTLDIPAYTPQKDMEEIPPGAWSGGPPVEMAAARKVAAENPFIFNMPVRGDDFFNREAIIDLLLRATITGKSQGDAWITGAGKVGKTSLLWHIQRKYENYDKIKLYGGSDYYTPVFLYLNVQDSGNRDNFYRMLRQSLKNLFDIKIQSKGDAYLDFIEALKYIYLEQKSYIVFLLDEFDSFISQLATGQPQIAGRFLAELRGLLQGAPVKDNRKIFSCVFTAQYGYLELLQENKIPVTGSPLNIFQARLIWFLRAQVEGLIHRYLPNPAVRFSIEESDFCFEKTSGHPFLVQRLFSIMYDAKHGQPRVMDREAIEKEYGAALEELIKISEAARIPAEALQKLKVLQDKTDSGKK